MEYQQFRNSIENYICYYEKGLKKQANAYIEEFVKKIHSLESAEKDAILYRFTSDLCDKMEYKGLMTRGNGKIPHTLAQVLREWLYKRCMTGRMPELRWFYELFWSDEIGCEYAFDFLKKAYESELCDSKTVELLFLTYIDILQWGAHHFPEGCIITLEARNDALDNCKRILEQKEVDRRLQRQLKYYETLYSCYDMYVKEGKIKVFSQYCREQEIEFHEVQSYYYESR